MEERRLCRVCGELVATDRAVWVDGGGSPGCFPAITRINPKSNTVTATLNTASETGALALGPGALWYGTITSNLFARVDPTTNAILDRLKLPGPSFGATVGYGFVWVTDKRDNPLPDPADVGVNGQPSNRNQEASSTAAPGTNRLLARCDARARR